jgi:hypothetical protein
MIGKEIKKIEKIFIDYCNSKNYQVTQSDEANNRRLDISNYSVRINVNIYRTGTIQIQGKQSQLKAEMEELKAQIETNPHSFSEGKTLESKPCVTRYDINLPDIRTTIKENLNTLDGSVRITDNPRTNIEYRSKITRNSFALTLTQYNNGTLLLQGKTDKLFHDCCDFIEKIANPSDKDIIARYVPPSDEKAPNPIVAKYTPQLLEMAEEKVKEKLGDVYEYLEPHDRKWFVASECLCLVEIPLPEYSALVMPASKAFERFAKKILVDAGLFENDYFKNKSANFSALYDKKNPKRKSIYNRERYMSSYLDKFAVCLDMHRNFMMHSDESKVTKVESPEKAEEKVNDIFKDTKELFDYFNGVYSLL